MMPWTTRLVRVFAYGAPVDMRASFDRLSGIVTGQLGGTVTSGDMYLFVARHRRRAKVLYWDGTGLCLFSKRLEQGRFFAPWRQSAGEACELSPSELSLFLEGGELEGRLPLSPSPLQIPY